jgi:hypothetical protein
MQQPLGGMHEDLDVIDVEGVRDSSGRGERGSITPYQEMT